MTTGDQSKVWRYLLPHRKRRRRHLHAKESQCFHLERSAPSRRSLSGTFHRAEMPKWSWSNCQIRLDRVGQGCNPILCWLTKQNGPPVRLAEGRAPSRCHLSGTGPGSERSRRGNRFADFAAEGTAWNPASRTTVL